MLQAAQKFPVAHGSGGHALPAVVPSYAVYREPFKLGSPHVMMIMPNASVMDIVQRMEVLPADFIDRGVVMLNEHEIPRALWRSVRPKSERAILTFHMPVQGGGGGGGGGKQVLAIVAALALTVLSAGIATFGIPLLGVAGGTLASTLIAAGVSLAGSLLVNALITPPTRKADSQDRDSTGGTALEPASVTGNLLERNAPIPRVIGTRRIFPPFAFEPVTEFEGQNEIVHAVCVLAGPHELNEIRVGDVAIDDVADADLTIQTRDGFTDSPPLSYPQRYGRTFPVQIDMSVHGTSATDLSEFLAPLPVWHGTLCADDPDEVWLHFVLQGLLRQDALSAELSIPVRIRMRLRGDTNWRYLPELHITDRTQSQRRMQVKLFFGQTFTSQPPSPATALGWTSARKFVPAQNVGPTGTDWDADAYFSNGAGGNVYENGTEGTTNVINCTLTPDIAAFYLDHADWPRGIYDIEVIRGATFTRSSFTSSTYVYSGNVIDFFGFRDTLALPLTREGLLDRLSFLRAVSIKNRPPINEKNLAMIYIRARNRSINNLSVLASGYVRDWNETAQSWIDWTTTSNPAPHYRDILTGSLNFDPMPAVMLDDQSLLDWRQRCIDDDLICDLVAESGTIAELLRLVASCGFARPYQSELWGVIQDYQRASEAPIQIFTPRNMSGFSWSKAFPRLPAGFRVNYRDDNYEYTGRQMMVYRRGVDETDARVEQITYDGLVRRADILRRAQYDLLQAELRSVIYTFTAPIESIVCRRGSLVAVNTDILQRYYGYARVVVVVRY